jgi:hypothetical protein
LFKWIKQHLRIKSFLGNSENAIKTQIWIGVSVYLLVAIAKKTLGVEASLYTFLQVVGLTAFEKMPILQVFERSNSQAESMGRATWKCGIVWFFFLWQLS